MKWFSQFSTSAKQPINDINAILHSVKTTGVTLSIDELLQYQSKTALIDLKATKNLKNKLSGGYLARTKGSGMEFDEVRHYQNGDDIRAIDWRVTARTGETHTKLFREEVERPVLIATDLGNSMQFGSQLLFKSVQAAHLASLIAWHAKQRGDRIGGIVFNDNNHLEFKPRSRKQGVLHYLSGLVACHQQNTETEPTTSQEPNKSFEENCARLRQLARPGSLVYLITDGQNITPECVRNLTQIARHCELIICKVFDPLEQNLPESAQRLNVAITNGKQSQQLILGDSSFAKHYQQQANALMTEQKNTVKKAGARLLLINAAQTLEQQLTSGDNTWIR